MQLKNGNNGCCETKLYNYRQITIPYARCADKEYESAEEEARRQSLYDKYVTLIVNHNVLYGSGEKSYSLRMSKFGDWVGLPGVTGCLLQAGGLCRSGTRATS